MVAAQKKAKPKPTGRPKKGPDPTGQVCGVRFTESDRKLLDAIAAEEEQRIARGGVAVRVTVADVIRSLVRQEAERRGLVAA